MADGDRGLVTKVVLSVALLWFSTLTEIGTGPAPIGSITAVVGLFVLWGGEDILDESEVDG